MSFDVALCAAKCVDATEMPSVAAVSDRRFPGLRQRPPTPTGKLRKTEWERTDPRTMQKACDRDALQVSFELRITPTRSRTWRRSGELALPIAWIHAKDTDSFSGPRHGEVAGRGPRTGPAGDQVLFELYAGLRHPRVFAKPLSAVEAARRVAFLRQESGFPIGHTPESTILLTLIRFRRSPFCATKNRARCGNLYLLSPSPSPSERGLG